MTVPVRFFDTEDAADRAARWLQRAGIPAGARPAEGRFAVFVPADRHDEADAVLAQRKRGLSPVPQGSPSLAERVFNMENLLTAVFVVLGVGFSVLVLAVAFLVTTGLGVVASIALVIAGVAYFHFSGWHGAVKSPKRVTPKAGPITQDMFVTHDYRRAWLKDQLAGRDRIQKAQEGEPNTDNSESP